MSTIKVGENVRLFGLEIRKVSKLDQKECDIFKDVTVKLCETLNQFGWFLEHVNLYEFGLSESNLLFEHLETIKSLVHMYERNKFSSPGQCFSLGYHTTRLEEKVVSLQKFMTSFQKLKIQMAEQFEDMDMEDVVFDEEDVRNHPLAKAWGHILREVRYTETHIDILLIIIKYDVMRIAMGVDIVREYYNAEKRIKQHGDDVFKYEIATFTHGRNVNAKKVKKVKKEDKKQ